MPLAWLIARPGAADWVEPVRRRLSEQCRIQVDVLPQWSADVISARKVDVVLVDASNLDLACDQLSTLRAAAVPARGIALGCMPDEPVLQRVLRSGADEFVAAPVRAAEVALRVHRMLGHWPCAAEAQHAATNVQAIGLIGQHPAYQRALAQTARVAGTDAGVLLLGETGTGKELFAQAVHYLSPRAVGPWVPVNCGALPTELIESELFGHLKGAYTHALSARQGLIQQAEGGSLFLDEIDSLPLPAQAKLLRFLQSKEIRPLGANRTQRVDVRVIAASNRDLASQVAKGQFRQDLYFRLNVVGIALPALRERRSDIALLAQHFMQKFAARYGRYVDALTPGALRRLLGYAWPGNVRELMHVIERAVLLSNGPVLDAEDLQLPAEREESEDGSLRAIKARMIEQFERSYIEQLLAECGGNITHAARSAKKNRRAFFELMRKYEISARTAIG